MITHPRRCEGRWYAGAQSMNARATRFPYFDSLRALAALAIFLTHAHYVLLFRNGSEVTVLATHLDAGLQIFFAVSGFLLYRPFVRARLLDKPSPLVRAYAWRRFLRIAPAYWVALTLIAVFTTLPGVLTLNKAPLYYSLGQVYAPSTAIGGLVQAWSICVEAAFYAFLPVYAIAMGALPLRTFRARYRAELAGVGFLYLFGLAANLWALHIGATRRFGVFPLHLTLPCYLSQLSTGMALAVISVRYEKGPLPRLLRPVDRFPGIAWGMALVFWLISTQAGIEGFSGERISDTQWMTRLLLYTPVAVGMLLPAIFGDQTRGLVRRFMANRTLLWIGMVSYSLFLYHVVVLTHVQKLTFPGSNYFWVVGGLVISLALAGASYYLVERPSMSLKRLVGTRREPQPREAIAEPAPVSPEGAPVRATQAG